MVLRHLLLLDCDYFLLVGRLELEHEYRAADDDNHTSPRPHGRPVVVETDVPEDRVDQLRVPCKGTAPRPLLLDADGQEKLEDEPGDTKVGKQQPFEFCVWDLEVHGWDEHDTDGGDDERGQGKVTHIYNGVGSLPDEADDNVYGTAAEGTPESDHGGD